MALNPNATRPLPRRRPLNQPVPPPPAPVPAVAALAQPARPEIMPTRSQSSLTSTAPSDALKPDDEAVDDVITHVEDTGSLERAARKLSLFAKLNGGPVARASAESSPVRGGGDRKDVKQAGQAGYYDPEEEAYARAQAQEDECAVDDEEMEDGDRTDVEEVVHLQEIVEGMWVGDLVAAMDSPGLTERGITNIVSLLRPRLTFPSNFSVLPLEIDDSPDTDILTHLPSCVSWIGEALRKREMSLITSPSALADAMHAETERDAIIRNAPPTTPGGVLIHCQAGMSRSATVAAAYLITALGISPPEAIDMIQDRRPVIDPSETFRHQLGLFHSGDGKVTLRDRSTRHFYMERNTAFFMNGQTSAPAVDKMAKYPATPTPSQPATPSGGQGRRKIRCRACRRFLAVREHMMDHILDQAPLSRPRTPSNFALPAPAHRLSISSDVGSGRASPVERRGSVVSDVINPLTGLPGATRSRQPSMSNHDVSPLSPLSPLNDGGSVPFPRSSTPGLVLTAMTPLESAPVVDSPGGMSRSNSIDHRRTSSSPASSSPSLTPIDPPPANRRAVTSRPLQTAEQLASRLPPHLQALRSGSGSAAPSPISSSPPSSPEKETSSHVGQAGSGSGSGSGSGQGSYEGSRPASRRKSMLSMTPAGGERRGSSAGSIRGFGGELASTGTPILVNQKCSGYFVEPLTWMEPFLKSGQISGKIVCPNDKCGAKIGNFDWAGVQCGCREWVTPGFCISRSKVDEVW